MGPRVCLLSTSQTWTKGNPPTSLSWAVTESSSDWVREPGRPIKRLWSWCCFIILQALRPLYCSSIRPTVSWIILPTRFMTPIKWLLQGKSSGFWGSDSVLFFSLLSSPACLSVPYYQPFLSFTDSPDVCDGLLWLCRARPHSPVSSQPSSSSSLQSVPPDRNVLQHEKISHLRFLAQSFRFLHSRLR